MKLWRMLKKPRKVLKKVKFIYEPYRMLKSNYVKKRRNQFLNEYGIQLILDINKVLADTEAYYFVDCGTLLGLLRNGKLIQWDLDIDFGIYITPNFSWKDLEMFMNKIGLVLDHQFRYKGEVTEQTYKRGAASVDFFNHFNDETNSFFYSYYTKENYTYEKEEQMHTYFYKTCRISGTRILKIDEGNVPVPVEAEAYLEDLYGSSWRIPDPNWKEGSEPACICLSDNELGIIEKFN